MIDESNLSIIRKRLEKALSRRKNPTDHPIEIVAITKGFPTAFIVEAAELGLNNIGENRVQEAEEKFPQLPKNIKIKRRMVGHLQSNKTRRAVELFDTIDSVDSLSLAKKLSLLGLARGAPVETQLQVNVDKDISKFGFDPNREEELLSATNLEGINVTGLMTIGVFTTDERLKRETFGGLREIRESLNSKLSQGRQLTHLSMGMSGDYEIAAEEGATMVRIGTALFGPRPEQ
ncbi:MAG: YggS family pyridoxal phosphate-dependent enzyme [Candidatus Marinimicrobia bacterium]|nr:YggS family pyridoxal phosphate-dependent enzyme [Candidatus Neomarinimicrobiota bacterium]